MGEVSTHTFNKGMNQDLARSVIDNQTSFEIRNFRLNTSDGSSTTALENIEGTCSAFQDLLETGVVVAGDYVVVAEIVYYGMVLKNRGDVVTADGVTGFSGNVINQLYMIEAGHKVIGSINIRNQVVLFSTDNTDSCIYKAVMATDDEDGRFASFVRIYDDSTNDGGTLDFNTVHFITGVGRYETSTIQKVYWVDTYNNIRSCNIENNLTADGNVFANPGNLYFTTDRFDCIPNSALPKATLTDIVGGDIDVGIVQYTYQMYIKHGAETAFAPLSNVIHVARENDFLSHSNDYRGGELEEAVGKGFKITIDNSGNSAFNNVRVIALHRKTINDIPTIRIAVEMAIDENTNTITYTDVGNSVGELTLEELSIPDTNLFKADTVATKDNLLFAGNVEQMPFELSDWDARTYRFDSNKIGKLEEIDGSGYYIYGTGATKQGAGGAATLGDWEYFTAGTWDNVNWVTAGSIAGSTWSIPETADCINPYNDPDNEPTGCLYKFKADGTTLGAQGKNLSFTFGTENFEIDDRVSIHYSGIGTESVTDNESYKDYASPWRAGQERSWHRDEVYRTGFVFYDTKMRKSEARWSNDLKIPFRDTGTDVSTYDLIVTGTPAEAKMVYPKVNMTSLPSNAEYWQLVRVQRGSTDRSILAQGLINRVTGGPPVEPCGAQCTLANNDIFKLTAPEIVINKNITVRTGDYVEYIGNYGSGGNVPDSTGTIGTDNEVIYKSIEFNAAAKAGNHKVTVTEASILSPMAVTDSATVGVFSVRNYISSGAGSFTGAYGGTALFINAPVVSTNWVPWAASVTWCAVNYRRNVFDSAYGGNTYEARTINEYIPASDIEDTTGSDVNCKIGDTFITYFEYLNQIWDLNKAVSAANSVHEVVFIPVESSINCNLRHDKCHSDTYGATNNELMQEFAGTHVETVTSAEYGQVTDLYQYNTVYSEENEIVKFFPLPYDYVPVNEYDIRVKVSEIKINGESTDSWTKFNANEYIDVDSILGGINNLYLFKNHLMFFQDTGFGILSVNERSLISDNNPGELVLGTGDVLNRYDYISKNIGNNHRLGLIESSNSLYWFYDHEKAMYKYSPQQAEIPVSKLKGMQSWFNSNFTNGDSVIGVYDNKYNDVIFTLGNAHTIAYNEMFDVFSAFYDFVPEIYIKLTNDRYISSEDSYWLFYHNYETSGTKCLFYNATIPSHSTVKFLVTDNYSYTKTFDTINYLSVASYTSSTVQDYYNSTFNRVRIFNDYQNTHHVTLTYGTNLARKERSWTFVIPRDIVKYKEETNTNIFLAGNLDDTQPFKKRMRDKYIQIELDYYNTDHYKFVVPLINTKYRISHR